MTPPDIVERLRPALALLPVECHDTPDYAEATGPQFQAMTMRPDAFLALNSLPALFDTIVALRDKVRVLEEALSVAVAALGRVNVRCFDNPSSPLKPIGDIARHGLCEVAIRLGDADYDRIADAAVLTRAGETR